MSYRKNTLLIVAAILALALISSCVFHKYSTPTLKVNGKVVQFEGKSYTCYGDAPWIKGGPKGGYYLVQLVPND